MTNIQVKNWREKKALVMSLKYTPATQSMFCSVFLMFVTIKSSVLTTVDKNLKSAVFLFLLQVMILTHSPP